MSEHNVETQLLRLSVAVGVNVLAARYLAGLTGWNKDIGTAAAIGAMLDALAMRCFRKLDCRAAT